jgi:nitrate/nitrite transport system permease protein
VGGDARLAPEVTKQMLQSLNVRATLVSLVLLAVMLGVWELNNQPPAADKPLTEYEMLMGGAEQEARVPPPSTVIERAVDELSNPFYDAGPNDKGIGVQLAYSLYRVLTGYFMAALLAIPVGFLIGMSPLMQKALNPFIQVLRPISPLAWMPLALFIIKDSEASAIFVIFICSIWPMLINTAFGVAGVRKDWVNVARTHELSPLRTAFTVILPAAAPTILTGMRISIGIAWLVIVAAEMLVGGTGIGYYVWNEWNNLDLTSVIFSILMIGVVGMLLDLALSAATRLVQYQE